MAADQFRKAICEISPVYWGVAATEEKSPAMIAFATKAKKILEDLRVEAWSLYNDERERVVGTAPVFALTRADYHNQAIRKRVRHCDRCDALWLSPEENAEPQHWMRVEFNNDINEILVGDYTYAIRNVGNRLCACWKHPTVATTTSSPVMATLNTHHAAQAWALAAEQETNPQMVDFATFAAQECKWMYEHRRQELTSEDKATLESMLKDAQPPATTSMFRQAQRLTNLAKSCWTQLTKPSAVAAVYDLGKMFSTSQEVFGRERRRILDAAISVSCKEAALPFPISCVRMCGQCEAYWVPPGTASFPKDKWMQVTFGENLHNFCVEVRREAMRVLLPGCFAHSPFVEREFPVRVYPPAGKRIRTCKK